ncbi:hypothetical protein MHK_009889 [Candidatus Magnetomorum sp. HK-1]|nr:hypothetical protein MHK_009889 [Candidatus Magnetomorum sp. HK-1]
MQIQHTLNTESMSYLKQYVRDNLENSKISENKSQPGNVDYVSHISTSAKVMSRLDAFLNLGDSESLQIDDMSEDEQQTFLSMLSSLLSKGVMGYEVLEIENGQPEQHFIVNQIGSEETYNARLYESDDF